MGESTPALRWYQRAVPMGGLAAVALAATLYALPDDEVELSTTRQPQEFVELYLATKPQAVCRTHLLRFQLHSHLEERRTLDYRITVARGGEQQPVDAKGRVRLMPDRSKTVRTEVSAPSRSAYTVTIDLRGRPELIRIHCGASS